VNRLEFRGGGSFATRGRACGGATVHLLALLGRQYDLANSLKPTTPLRKCSNCAPDMTVSDAIELCRTRCQVSSRMTASGPHSGGFLDGSNSSARGLSGHRENFSNLRPLALQRRSARGFSRGYFFRQPPGLSAAKKALAVIPNNLLRALKYPAPSRRMLLFKTQAVLPRRHPLRKNARNYQAVVTLATIS